MFVRILIAAAVLLAAVLLMRHLRAKLDAARRPPAIEAKMIRCAQCGTYFARGDGVRSNGRDYCSEAHASEGSSS